MCHLDAVEDEKHFVLECPRYSDNRSELFRKLQQFTSFDPKSPTAFEFLMSCMDGDSEVIKLVVDYVSTCVILRCSQATGP